MYGREHPTLVDLRNAREATILRLSHCFARDQISLEEFERRVDAAYACRVVSEFRTLLIDLGDPLSLSEPVQQDSSLLAVASPSEVISSGRSALGAPRTPRLLALFGNVERGGHFQLDSGCRVLSVFGNVELDLREVVLPPGVTDLHLKAVFGNIEITVPPTVAVECHGTPVLGSFSSLSRLPSIQGSESILRITGSAFCGNVEIKTLPLRAILALKSG